MKQSLKLKYVYKGSDWEEVFEIGDDWNNTQIRQFAISVINRKLGFCEGDCEFVLLYGREDEIKSKTEIQYYRCYNVIEKPPQTKPTKASRLYPTSSDSSGGSRVSYSNEEDQFEEDVSFPHRPNLFQTKEVGNQSYKGIVFQTKEEEESDDEDNSYYHNNR